MNKEERIRVYRLLGQYYPNARQLRSAETLTAWGLVLEKFTYADVKARVVAYAARNKFFPDIADIVGDLTEQTDGVSTPDSSDRHVVLDEKWVAWCEARKKEIAATGGPCQIRALWDADRAAGKSMMEGLFLWRHFPEDCAGCPRMAVGGECLELFFAERIGTAQEDCLILKNHRGEAHQSELLKRYWRELCWQCPVIDCFWREGMRMI